MKNKNKISYEAVKARAGYSFIALWLLGFVLFFILPFIQSVRYSFSTMNITPGNVQLTFVAFENYENALFVDTNFLPSFINSVTMVFTKTPLIILFSLFIAIIINKKFRGRTFFRAVFFIPIIVTGGVVIDIINSDSILNMIMNGERAAMMFDSISTESILKNMEISSVISNYIVEIVAEILNISWYSGIQILLFLAGLQSVSPSLYEVSKVEGATAWDDFWKITIPMLSPIILVNIMYTIIDIFINYSNPTFKYIQEIQSKINFPLASAMAIICFIFVFITIGVIYLIINKRIYYAID